MIPKIIIHLLSGGMDSVVMLYDLHGQGHNIHAVLFDYKQRHIQELQWAKHHCRILGLMFTTIKIPQLKGSELTAGSGGVVVPNRNAIFLSHAVNLAVAANANTVTYACNSDDEKVFPDCRMAFVQTFNNMLRTSEIQVEVCAPYIDKRKWWIAGLGKEMGIDFSYTWSCYRGGKEPCGECGACLKRKEALADKNVNQSGHLGSSQQDISR